MRALLLKLLFLLIGTTPWFRAEAKTLITAQYGYNFYSGNAVTEMNIRLGNSPVLSASKQFGQAQGFLTSATFDFKKIPFSLEGSIARFSESFHNISEFDDGPENFSSFTGYQVFAGLGGKIYPLPTRTSRNNENWQPPPSQRKGKFWKRLYAMFFVGSGLLVGNHDFALEYPRTDTHIEYSTRAIHYAHGGTLRGGMNVIPNLDLVLEFSYFVTRKASGSTQLTKFTLEGQDQAFEKSKAKLDVLVNSPFRIMRFGVGLAFTP